MYVHMHVVYIRMYIYSPLVAIFDIFTFVFFNSPDKSNECNSTE